MRILCGVHVSFQPNYFDRGNQDQILGIYLPRGERMCAEEKVLNLESGTGMPSRGSWVRFLAC